MTDLDRVYELAEAPTQNFIHQIIFVVDHAKDKPLLKEAGRVWGRKPQLLKRIFTSFGKELERTPDFFELMSMYEMCRLNEHDRAKVAKQWRDYTWSYERVADEVKKLMPERKGREKRVVTCPKCGELIA